MRRFRTVAVGGTFDSLHGGHKALLVEAFKVGDRVLIGLCSDEFIKTIGKKHATAGYEHRLKELEDFLLQNNLLERAEILPLHDKYGPAGSSRSIDALIVSRETETTAYEINKKRKGKKIRALQIIVIDMVASKNHAPISSTRIRSGEIDREGNLLKR